MKNPTIRDLARVSGFSRSTISAALRNKAIISQKTKDAVNKLAEEHGYQRDAQIGHLMGYLSSRKKSHAKLPIAWLFIGSHQGLWNEASYMKNLIEGSRKQADLLGYKIEQFWLNAPRMNPKRMRQILRSRGIQGIIIAPPYDGSEFKEFNYDGFACVKLQSDTRHLSFDAVIPDYVYNFDLAYNYLKRNGVSRIGYACISEVEELNYHLRECRYSWNTRDLDPDCRIPVFKYHEPGFWKDRKESRRRVLDWIVQWNIEVIICSDGSWLNKIREFGIKVPEEVGLVSLKVEEDEFSGIDQRSQQQGAAAVNLLLGLLNRNETGKSEIPKATIIKGQWTTGSTWIPK